MSSNNNPETGNNTTNTGADDAVSTAVAIGDFKTDIATMNVADGLKLHAALGTLKTQRNYQAEADKLVPFIEHFQSIMKDLPPELQQPDGMQKFLAGLKKTGGKLVGNESDQLKSWYNGEGGAMLRANGIGTGLQLSGDAANLIGDSLAEGGDGWMLWGRMFDAAKTSTALVTKGAALPISHDQAVGIASSIEAVKYMYTESPDAPNATKLKTANWLDKIVANVESVTDSIWHNVPEGLAAIIPTIGKWATNGFDWNKAWTESLNEVHQFRATTKPLTAEETLARNMSDKVEHNGNEKSVEALQKAGTVAGVNVAPMAEALSHPTIVVNNDGTIGQTDGKGNGATPLVNPMTNHPLTTNDVHQNAWGKAKGGLFTHGMIPGAIGVTAAVVSTQPLVMAARAVNNAAAGFTSGLAHGFSNGKFDLDKVERAGDLSHHMGGIQAFAGQKLDAVKKMWGKGVKESLDSLKATEEQIAEIAGAQKTAAEQAMLKARSDEFARISDYYKTLERQRLNVTAPAHKAGDAVDKELDALAKAYGDKIATKRLGMAVQARETGETINAGGHVVASVLKHAQIPVRPTLQKIFNAHSDIIVDEARAPTQTVVGQVSHQVGKLFGHLGAKVEFYSPTQMWADVKKLPESVGFRKATQVEAATAVPVTAGKAEEIVVKIAEATVEKTKGKGKIGLIVGGIAAAVLGIAGGAEAKEEYEHKPKDKRQGSEAVAIGIGATKPIVHVVADGVGYDDFAKADLVRGGAKIADWTFLPVSATVDEQRLMDHAKKAAPALVAQVEALVPANASKDNKHNTGDTYLDRIAALKEMKARGVTQVGVNLSGVNAVYSMLDHVGAIAYEGKETLSRTINEEVFKNMPVTGTMAMDTFKSTPMTIDQAIELNTRLYVAQGGTVVKATQSLGITTHSPAAQKHPEPLTHDEIIATMAKNAEVIQQARMAASRPTARKEGLVNFNLGIKCSTGSTSLCAVLPNGLPSPTPTGTGTKTATATPAHA